MIVTATISLDNAWLRVGRDRPGWIHACRRARATPARRACLMALGWLVLPPL